jgi:hypothetical protein
MSSANLATSFTSEFDQKHSLLINSDANQYFSINTSRKNLVFNRLHQKEKWCPIVLREDYMYIPMSA